MRLVGLFSPAKDTLSGLCKTCLHVHESMLSGRPMALLEKGGIAQADRWFNPSHIFWRLSPAGVGALMHL